MPHKTLDIAGSTIAWAAALSAACLALVALWFSRHQPIEMDLAMMHYSAFLINEKHLLLYRDIFENNLPGPFMFHALIGRVFGYDAHPIRFLDACVLFSLSALSWKILNPISKTSAVFAPAFFTFVYLSGGTVATFQRDYIATLPIAAALALLCRKQSSPRRDAAFVGALCGLACGFKPNFIVVFPALYWILLLKNPASLIEKLKKTIIPAGSAFVVIFAIPFLWALQHADLKELLELYKTYTPIYVSTRNDLFHYENLQQQVLDIASMQFSHLVKMSLAAIPGLLWAWRQQRNNTIALASLRYLAIVTFAIAWHEVIAGKFWFAHLLAPYFFAILCFSLLLTPAHPAAKLPEKMSGLLIAVILAGLAITGGAFIDQHLYNKHYDSDNYNIRSQKIARYLKKNMREDDKVQSLDGSGDGQGSLLLAKATTATRFVEDIPLYLQPDSPITQGFRREFLDTMKKNPPAFFVYIHNFFHPAGGNRLKEFRELNQFLKQNYNEVEVEDGEYTIYKRK